MAASLVTVSLGVAVGVLVAGPASASSPTTTTTTTTTTLSSGSDPNSPAARYLVINGTVDAASDHEILGSSAFPNYATGAVDNYYSKAHSHVDNSPFAQGTASPADTGPIGQTAAAGNFQQPQYADARWPGGSGKATYGSQGGPYAVAGASEYNATAESSAASSGLSGPSGSSELAVPKGFDGRLREALAAWKAKWQGRLEPKRPPATVTTPTATIPTPAATVTTPTATVTTPTAPVGGLTTPPSVTVPSVTVPSPPVPSATATGTTTPSRSLSSAPRDGASLLESSTRATLDPKTGALVTSGESRLGRVSLGGGQIVLEGIHVSATITNDGTPSEKVAVSVGTASIGGVPVTIDQDGVHVAGQSQGLPYRQASDALNSALKQAGIQLFIVAPEIKTSSCDQTGTTTGGTTTTTTTNSSDQTGTTPTSTSCDQTGTTTTTTSSYQTGTTTTTTTSKDRTGTTSTSTWCDQTGTTPASTSCDQTGTTTTTNSSQETGTTTTTTSRQETGTTTTTTSSDQTGTTTTNSGEETVTATGLHVVFTQPVAQSGVPAQYAEHILGEVFLDSLAVPAGPVPNLDLNLNLNLLNLSSCLTGRHSGGKKTSGGASTGGGGSSAGGSTSSSSSSPSTSSQPTSSWTGSGSQPTSSSPGNALQASSTGLASALRKPLWLLVAYLLWQALVIVTGASLWSWRRGGAS